MPDLKRIILTKEHSVAHVKLHRPDKHNGLNEELICELILTAKLIRKDRSIRAVILSGAGESFCAGLDIKGLNKNPTMVPRLFAKLPWTEANTLQRVAYIWRKLPVPVIAIVQGNCFGAGLQIALAADFRFTTPDSRWSLMEAKWGLIPDMSVTTTLTTLVRYDIAQELAMTGRIFSGKEAKKYGLVTKVSQCPLKDAEHLVQRLIQQSPDQIAATKLLLRKTWTAGARRALLWERWIQLRLLGRRNNRIALHNNTQNVEGDKLPFADRSLF